ncbi:MAG: RNA 2',3'-cyclic phosphodiesterase [Stenotrophomonas nitritireducens]|uniref:RNA 2',3'-cyclic phosphodiesterase n=1 Tax=Stenotrophomonas nitritireducens TaxID=83617 RepID=A0A9D8KXN4_9GAMM|nr:RNA 2',3'-cyclic phosphodiesterase [Stenotrophomonas nitritireducens]
MTKFIPSAEAQLSLGLGSDIPTERLFFAVMPDPATAWRIAELAEGLRGEHGLDGRPLARERLHVTLHHLGDYAGLPPSLLAKVQQAAARVRMPEFEVCFDEVGSFAGGRQHPFVLRSEHGADLLQGLHQELARCLQAIGSRPDPGFTPHLTLLYDKRRLPVQPVQPMRWLVREFVLIRSYLGQTRYQMEGRWSLG